MVLWLQNIRKNGELLLGELPVCVEIYDPILPADQPAVAGVADGVAGVFGIKDFGNIMPGHGGILDRFDSVTIVAPLAEVLLLILPMAVK